MSEPGAIAQPRPIADGVVVSCSLCRYFKPILTDPNGGGTCHKHCPALVMSGMSPAAPLFLFDIWPPVSKAGWCGEGVVGLSAESLAIGQAALDKKDHGGKG